MDYFYVTALSNFIMAYDKYQRIYSKAALPQSTFPDKFFVLTREDLHIGIEKAEKLRLKIGKKNDQLVILRTTVNPADLKPNLETGRGQYQEQNYIVVSGVEMLKDAGDLPVTVTVEDAAAKSMLLLEPTLAQYEDIIPRSVSLLPIAIGCQAACPFCFSKASTSRDQKQFKPDLDRIGGVLKEAKERGATRCVITGGGEPGLVPHDKLLQMVGICGLYYDSVLMITNAYSWATLKPDVRLQRLVGLADAGLTRIAISRHHHDVAQNTKLMKLNTRSEEVVATWNDNRALLRGLDFRWICVLQKGGVEDRESLEQYLDWAASTGVSDVCFKELYVSTSTESEYHSDPANIWSRAHQVPLKIVLDYAREQGWKKIAELPWGAPIYEGTRQGKRIRMAAYTEPSLLWERHNRLCRSWNMMSDGRVLASLEDKASEVFPKEAQKELKELVAA